MFSGLLAFSKSKSHAGFRLTFTTLREKGKGQFWESSAGVLKKACYIDELQVIISLVISHVLALNYIGIWRPNQIDHGSGDYTGTPAL
jgi:hypothetical protein